MAALGWEGETEITVFVVSQRLGAPKIHNFSLSMDAMFPQRRPQLLRTCQLAFPGSLAEWGCLCLWRSGCPWTAVGHRNCWGSGRFPSLRVWNCVGPSQAHLSWKLSGQEQFPVRRCTPPPRLRTHTPPLATELPSLQECRSELSVSK